MALGQGNHGHHKPSELLAQEALDTRQHYFINSFTSINTLQHIRQSFAYDLSKKNTGNKLETHTSSLRPQAPKTPTQACGLDAKVRPAMASSERSKVTCATTSVGSVYRQWSD